MLTFFKKIKKTNQPKTVLPKTPSCLDRLNLMKENGFSPTTVIDGGASVGYWSWAVGKMFPGCQILAIEPNEKIIPKTKELLGKMRIKAIIEQCAIGATDSTAHLNIWDNDETKMSGSSIKSHVQGDPRQALEVKLSRLDTLCEKHNLQPELIKLDLQGYELDALNGAANLLKTTEVFIIEFGCLEAYEERTTPHDLLNVLYANDYCLYDVVDLIYRPYDNALTGGDFIFVKNTSQLKAHKGYS